VDLKRLKTEEIVGIIENKNPNLIGARYYKWIDYI
jgi:hypothetical protein